MAGLPALLTQLAALDSQRQALLDSASRSFQLPDGYKLNLHLRLDGGAPRVKIALIPNTSIEDTSPAVLRAVATVKEKIEAWISGTSATPL